MKGTVGLTEQNLERAVVRDDGVAAVIAIEVGDDRLAESDNRVTLQVEWSGEGPVADSVEDFPVRVIAAEDQIGAAVAIEVAVMNGGDGTFRTGRLISTELPGYSNLNAPEAIAVADFDGDGNADIIALISYPQVAEIFYGNGDGTFNGPFLMTLSAAYTQIAAADVNQDGKPDLVLSDGNIICVIHNEGNRTFGPEVHYLAGPVGNFEDPDLNGDGYPDIIVANGGLSSSR